MNELKIHVYSKDDAVLVVLEGRLRIADSEAARERILDAVRSGPAGMAVDLSRLMEVDSAGLGVLVGCHITARNKGVPLQLLSPNEQLQRLMRATRLDRIFNVVAGQVAGQQRDALENPDLLVSADQEDPA